MRISRLRILWKTPLRFSSWVCLGSLNRSSPTLDDSSRTYQTAFRNRLWRSSTHWLINGYPHPLWRRNKHHNRVIRRGFYPVRVVQQENDRQHRFSLRGSHQVVSELRLFLVWISFNFNCLESSILGFCSCWFLNFLSFLCSWTVLNFLLSISVFVFRS